MSLRDRQIGHSILCTTALCLTPTVLRAADTNSRPLLPNQSITRGTPPQSPAKFDPDPNRLILPTNLPPATNWSRRVLLNTNAPPALPGRFNPDPGAMLRTNQPAPTPFFQTDPAELRADPRPEIPPARALPRSPVSVGELQSPQPATPGSFNNDPLPANQSLPRENTRHNLKIHQDFHGPHYHANTNDYPANTSPRPDRWHVGFTPWKRYTSGVTEQPYENPQTYLWHPYRQSLLKGDAPIIGQDIFLNLTASTQTELEFRRIPTASGVSAAVPGAYEFYGVSEQIGLQNNVGLSVELFKGETAFKPVEWAIKLEPVFNLNYVNARETGVISPDPRGSLFGNNNTPPPNNDFILDPSDIDALLNGQIGPAGSFRSTQHTDRTRTFVALQQAFGELHLRDLTDNYDFIAFRGGYQPFISDFRGFIFNDINLGGRIMGNWDNNRFQYNLSVFDMREKDTNSELNTFEDRDQEVIIANLYRQDFIWKGYTAQVSFHANIDHGGTHYDKNGNIVRPAPIGAVRAHDVNAYYLGWAGDGHTGRFNK
jgi:hypothetical protein